MTEQQQPLTTDADLVAAMEHLVGAAIRRQTWVLLIDEDRSGISLAVPMDGVPADPDPEDVATLADRVRLLVDAVPDAAEAVVVWERPGGPALHMQEADWVAALAATDAPVRAQLLSSDDGVRLLDPEFEGVVAA